MNTITISEARSNLYKLAEKTLDSHEPITVTTKHGNVVILSQEDFESIQETLYILQTVPKIVERVNEAKKGKGNFCTRDKLPW